MTQEAARKTTQRTADGMERTAALVGVIVPVYNGENYLQECIDSVLSQTFRDLELWLIDDGSRDGSGALCDKAAVQDTRVHVIHKKNEGLMATWIRGVTECRAPYLCFLDCDDWLERDCLEKMTASLAGSDASGKQVICGGYVIEREWNHTKEKKGNAAAPGVYEGECLRRELQERLLGNENRTLILSRCMKLFSRELLLDNLHFCDPKIRMGEDVSITVPVLLDAERVVVLAENYDYHYRFVSDSMAHGYDAGMYDNIRRLLDILHLEMEEKRVPNGHLQAEQEFLFLFLLVLKNEMRRQNVPEREVVSRVQELCRRENAAERIRKYGKSIRDPANRLLSFVMKKPSGLRIRAVRSVFLLQARGSRKAEQ